MSKVVIDGVVHFISDDTEARTKGAPAPSHTTTISPTGKRTIRVNRAKANPPYTKKDILQVIRLKLSSCQTMWAKGDGGLIPQSCHSAAIEFKQLSDRQVSRMTRENLVRYAVRMGA